MWHAEVGSLILRRYDRPDGYELRLQFNGVGACKMLGPGVCFIEGALRTDGKPLSLGDWQDLARMLRDQHGIRVIKAKRVKADGQSVDVDYPTHRV